jgi:protein-glutamine gamma-glutamyltransferase
LTLLGFGGWLGRMGWQRWRRWRRLAALDPMASLYQQWLDWLADQGWVKRSSQTPWEYLQMVRQDDRGSSQVVVALQAVTAAYMGWRYGGQTVAVEAFQQELRQLQRQQWRSHIQQHRLSQMPRWPARWLGWRQKTRDRVAKTLK